GGEFADPRPQPVAPLAQCRGCHSAVPLVVPSSDAFTLSPLHAGERTSRSAQEQPPVMPGHSRSKNGVASPRLCPGQDERGKAESRNGRSRHGRTRTSLLSTVRAKNSAHSRESGNPGAGAKAWVPAFAGTSGSSFKRPAPDVAGPV